MKRKTVTHAPTRASHALWRVSTCNSYVRVSTRSFLSSRKSEAPGCSGSRAERFAGTRSRAVKGRVGLDPCA